MLIRFKKNDGTEYPQWEEKRLGELTALQNKKSKENNYEVYSISNQNGFIPQNMQFEDRLVASENRSNYKVVEYRNYAYNPSRINVGSIAFLKENKKIIVSPLYVIFKCNENELTCEFLDAFLKTNCFRKGMLQNIKGSVRESLDYDGFSGIKIKLPCLEEQQKIADFLSTVDQKIEAQKAIVADYEELKKGTMQKIFNQEIRFKDDDGNEFPEWEEKKLGETLLIQRGGSPRPISNYITNDEDGYNWIKIGDVSPNTNIIQSTKEKIKPEGLSKTRQVYIGDLILSNSMSFGRPYILEINGCIHDGWLLIRKYEKNFDREFLCCLLASNQVKKQYEKLSAGSTVQNLNSNLVKSVKVNVPCLEEQKKIADCLSALDRKIESEMKILADLEELKKGLLQAIFN